MSDLEEYLKKEFERLKREGTLDPEIVPGPDLSSDRAREIAIDWVERNKALVRKHRNLIRQHVTEMAVASTVLSELLGSTPSLMPLMLLMGSSVMEVITTSYALGVKDGMEMERLNRVWGSEDTKASEDG
jgi:hypothetical protein